MLTNMERAAQAGAKLQLNIKAMREGWNRPACCLDNATLAKVTHDGLTLTDEEREEVNVLLNTPYSVPDWNVQSTRIARGLAASIAAHQRMHGLIAW